MKTLVSCLFLLALAACVKPIYDDGRVESRFITIYFRDSVTNGLLIGRSGQPFHTDSIVVVEAPAQPYYGISTGYGQVSDTTGQAGITFGYYTDVTKDSVLDLTPLVFDKTYYLQLNRFDVDTVRFEKPAGADVRLSWNGRFITDLPRNVIRTAVTIRK